MLGMSERKAVAWVQCENAIIATAVATEQERALNKKTIKADAPQYWADLRNELKTVAESLAQPLIGRFHHSNFDTSRSEDHCQIKVSFIGDGSTHRNGYVDVRYRPDSQEIWFKSTLSGERISLRPCVVDGSICTATESHPEPMDAEAAAEFIARPLVRHAMSGILASV
jgi:hypothetical protein